MAAEQVQVVHVANTAWASATPTCRDKKLVADFADAAERLLSKSRSQQVANTAWASATLTYCEQKLFADLAEAAERLLNTSRSCRLPTQHGHLHHRLADTRSCSQT